jgi:CopA family copper-resistance protein
MVVDLPTVGSSIFEPVFDRLKSMPTSRRQLLRGVAAASGGAALTAFLPALAQAAAAPRALPVVSGEDITLTVGHVPITVDGKRGHHSIGINGSIPGPLIRLKEGQKVRIKVVNTLDEETSIHWHGLLLPFQMDGVPGVSFPGIKAGQSFTYAFDVKQAGTYWYHSHSGVQELIGMAGPIVIDPAGPEPAPYDREHVVVLTDYSFMHPHLLMQRLKAQSGYFNMQKQTIAGLLAGRDQPLKERQSWAQMRMDPTDILDVTGSTYRYLINGHGPGDNWTGLFTPGERVRLRFVNAGAMTIFNVRIPGLPMTVVQADGIDVRPVEVDELQIANAETYDVIVTPKDDRAYTLVAETIDRSGMARGTLAPRAGMTAAVPPLRKRSILTMKDMGMGGHAGHGGEAAGGDMAGMDHSAHGGAAAAPASAPAPTAAPAPAMSHAAAMLDPRNAPQVKMGPGVQMISPTPVDRVGDRGTGLEKEPHRVLVYTDLVALAPGKDRRTPSRQMEIHLTGNMERFMWGLDGEKFSDGRAPFAFRHGERVRVTLVNDTMMNHPIHLHGHFMELVNGRGELQPRKHTINVLPGGKATFDLTADALGDWAFHCHMLLHMHSGMFNVVTVRHEHAA